MEQRNTEHWRNNGKPRNSGRTTEHPGTPAEDTRTTEPNKTKNDCSDFKGNINLTLINLTLSTQGENIFNC